MNDIKTQGTQSVNGGNVTGRSSDVSQQNFDAASRNALQNNGGQNDNLDQVIRQVQQDPGLRRNVSEADMQTGIESLEGMNNIIRQAADATGAADDGRFDQQEVLAMNDYIKQNFSEEWSRLHGNDEGNVETGFHKIQGDGGTLDHNGKDFIDTKIDGMQHLGFDFNGENFVNEDGDANATLDEMTDYLNTAYFGNFDDGLVVGPENNGGGAKTGGGGKAAPAEAAAPEQAEAATPVEEAPAPEEAAPAAEEATASEAAEEAAPIEPTGGTEAAQGVSGVGGSGLDMNEIMELLMKLLNGEELTDEEKAQLGQAMSAFMDEEGNFDEDTFKTALAAAGIELGEEELGQVMEAAKLFTEGAQAVSGEEGDLASLTPEDFAEETPEMSAVTEQIAMLGEELGNEAGSMDESLAASDSLASLASEPDNDESLFGLLAA